MELRWRRLAGWMVVSGVLTAGCGPGSSEAFGDSESAQDSDTPSTTDAEIACVPSPVAGDDPIDEAVGCAAFDLPEEIETPTVTVRIVNATDAAILVLNRTAGCGQPARHFDVVGTIGGRPARAPTGYCPSEYGSCQTWLGAETACNLCGTIHAPFVIAPGESIEESWHAWMLLETEVSAACNVVGEDNEACMHEVALSPGTYTISTEAIRLSECPECWCDELAVECSSWTAAGRVPPSLFAEAVYDGECGIVELMIAE
jgi:hypothetical protein